MSKPLDHEQIPVLWINLNRAHRRRNRMQWALKNGGWTAYRFNAVDADDCLHHFLPLPNFFNSGSSYPGLYRANEAQPFRSTSRAELACLASWKRLLLLANRITSGSGWFLLLEDDIGASLAVPEYWAHSLHDLISYCPSHTLAIQLAPISATVRDRLFNLWNLSQGSCLAVRKTLVRSHGNGAVLLHQRALNLLFDPFLYLTSIFTTHLHPLSYPWRIRPVADKWLYAALPPNSCYVATYPHFCLDAEDSALHSDHVDAYHRPSRETTINIWDLDHRFELINAQYFSDSL